MRKMLGRLCHQRGDGLPSKYADADATDQRRKQLPENSSIAKHLAVCVLPKLRHTLPYGNRHPDVDGLPAWKIAQPKFGE